VPFSDDLRRGFILLAEKIYLKTTVFEHDILSDTWKSEQFVPTLSARWDQVESTINIPLVNEESLEHVSIKVSKIAKIQLELCEMHWEVKSSIPTGSVHLLTSFVSFLQLFFSQTTVATKTKLGKKIVLGTLHIRPDLDDLEQWATMLSTRNVPIPMWYSFD
jgi:hypothetical protein